jgi:hypothetical protein
MIRGKTRPPLRRAPQVIDYMHIVHVKGPEDFYTACHNDSAFYAPDWDGVVSCLWCVVGRTQPPWG